MGLTDEDIESVKEGRKSDKKEDAELEAMPGPEGGGGAGGAAPGAEPGALTAGYERKGDIVSAGVEKAEAPAILEIENEDLPLKAEKKIRNAFGKDIETGEVGVRVGFDKQVQQGELLPGSFNQVLIGDVLTFPKQVEIKLPQLKKVETPQLKKVELPKLQKING